jgi:aminobenzoyl-glutamate utilization protein B
VSCARTEIGHKAAVHAGKVLAATAIDLMERPDILEKAREEFEVRTAEGYTCPIPEGAVPIIAD